MSDTAEDLGEALARNGWAPIANHMYCKVLYHVNNTPCTLTIDGDMYETHIRDDTVPLDQLGCPDAITTLVVYALILFQ